VQTVQEFAYRTRDDPAQRWKKKRPGVSAGAFSQSIQLAELAAA
jgi:hypothetical protein